MWGPLFRLSASTGALTDAAGDTVLELDLLNFPPPYRRDGDRCDEDEALGKWNQIKLHSQGGKPAQQGIKEERADKGSREIGFSRLKGCGSQETCGQNGKQEGLSPHT